jgi:hypothetical protein
MSKEKKSKKVKVKKEKVSLLEKLRNQADKKNNCDCKDILAELDQASIDGEHIKIVKLRVNQVHYIEKLGLPIKLDRPGFYEISWK